MGRLRTFIQETNRKENGGLEDEDLDDEDDDGHAENKGGQGSGDGKMWG